MHGGPRRHSQNRREQTKAGKKNSKEEKTDPAGMQASFFFFPAPVPNDGQKTRKDHSCDDGNGRPKVWIFDDHKANGTRQPRENREHQQKIADRVFDYLLLGGRHDLWRTVYYATRFSPYISGARWAVAAGKRRGRGMATFWRCWSSAARAECAACRGFRLTSPKTGEAPAAWRAGVSFPEWRQLLELEPLGGACALPAGAGDHPQA